MRLPLLAYELAASYRTHIFPLEYRILTGEWLYALQEGQVLTGTYALLPLNDMPAIAETDEIQYRRWATHLRRDLYSSVP